MWDMWDMWQNLMSRPVTTSLLIVVTGLTINFVTCLTDKYCLKASKVEGERPPPCAPAAPPYQRLLARCVGFRRSWSGGGGGRGDGRGRCWDARVRCRWRLFCVDGGSLSCTSGGLLPACGLCLSFELSQLQLQLQDAHFSRVVFKARTFRHLKEKQFVNKWKINVDSKEKVSHRA